MTRRPGARINVTGRAVTAGLGAAMVAVPAAGLPAAAYALTLAGLLLVAASVAGPFTRITGTGSLAAVAAVAECAAAAPGIPVMAADGLLILGYLILLDAPWAAPGHAVARWLGRQGRPASWGAAAVLAVLAALAVQLPPDAWLAVTGIAAATAAAVIAIPRSARSRDRHSAEVAEDAVPAAGRRATWH